MNEEELSDRKEIFDMVNRYYNKYHIKTDKFKVGDRIPYAGRCYNEKEMVNLVDSALEFWLTNGKYTDKFEKDFAKYLNIEHVALVNSGSSANLIAFMALTSPLLKERAIKRGDEIITVACGFPTTISMMVQFGAVPVFLDVTIPQYNIDVSMLEKAYSPKVKAVMIAHTLGNPFDLVAVKYFCDKHKLWLIEDNCDALGSKIKVDGEMKFTGTIGDIGTSSFYPAHHMTMGEGGAVYTNNSLLAKIIYSLRDWGRDCVCRSGEDNTCNNRFKGVYGDMPEGYDHKYVYSHFGYNLKATDMQAAIGCAQIEKLEDFCAQRIKNFNKIKEKLQSLKDYLILPEACLNSQPSWFGFLITCKKIDRNKIVNFLEDRRIQTRVLFAGNITKQPCFNEMRERNIGYRIVGNLENTDRIMNNSFWIGVYPGMTDDMIEYMTNSIKEGVSQQLLEMNIQKKR